MCWGCKGQLDVPGMDSEDRISAQRHKFAKVMHPIKLVRLQPSGPQTELLEYPREDSKISRP